MKLIPTALIIFRFLSSPFLLWDAIDGNISPWFLGVYIAAFLSDIFDGVIARHLGISTQQLRQADSWADICLYLSVAISAWFSYPDVLIALRYPLLTVIAFQAVWWIINLVKYGKPASYHTYSAKTWGITLFIAVIALFGFHQGNIALIVASVVGIVHTIEEIAMTLILPQWVYDVPSILHALKLRDQLLSETVAIDP